MSVTAMRAENVTQNAVKYGRWKRVHGDYVMPGGTPIYACGRCGGSEHLHGAEYPKRKMICDVCGRINAYPWDKVFEEGSSLWEEDENEAD